MNALIRFPLLSLSILTGIAPGVQAGQVRFRVVEPGSNEPLPSRVHVQNDQGEAQRAAGLPFWRDHFVCDGSVALELPAGTYTYAVERGPEYSSGRGAFALNEGAATNLTVTLTRLADLAAEGWWSGDLHVHRPPEHAELLMRAEDLHVGPVITWWNQANPWKDRPLPAPLPVRFDGNRFHHPMSGEDERDGGALLFHNLAEPVNLIGATRHHPSSLVYARRVRQHPGAWIDIEKPFWWDLPMWLAHGMGDSIGIAHNHMHRGGVLENEAWGRARDPSKYPGPHGNGLWTQDIYYHLLNCGLRIPPSAGSASGVLPNPVGYDRVYVQIDGALTYDGWWEGLRAGRAFVSNGPLLRCRANGQWPGHVFRTNGALHLVIEGRLDSRDPIRAVELVRNGKVEPITLPASIAIEESGWFLVRAIADVAHTFRFASTAPFYVEIGSAARPIDAASARFFLDWTRERLAQLNLPDAQQAREVRRPWEEAEHFWRDKVDEARRTGVLRGEVIDQDTGLPLPSRVYIRGEDGAWHFAESAGPGGAVVRYDKQNWVNRNAVERHVTLSPHPFLARLEPGRYTVTVERGKEYRALTRAIDVGAEPLELRLPIRRWVDMAKRGWYSGDTHVHRTLEELPNVMLAEDVNVALPLTHWVTKAFAAPAQGDKSTEAEAGAALIRLDDTHVIHPRNTEYEIFTVGDRRHTLGAVFVLNHQSPLEPGAPPVRPIAEQARREGALLDLDKHDWPWSMALVPVMNVDLFELANNHVWRTEFGFTNWNADAAALFGTDGNKQSGGERDWIEFGMRNYYALLNCGFRLRPTAGTASGVHPVPLGFGRVYVHLPDGFSYEAWIQGLDAGRSFVTTGPMALVRVNGQDPGHRFTLETDADPRVTVEGLILSEQRPATVEILINGEVARRFHCLEAGTRPEKPLPPHESVLFPTRNQDGAFETRFFHAAKLRGSSWVAARCWEEREGGRVRFAHTAPWHFDQRGAPLRPRKTEAEYLVRRVREEIERSRDRLPPAALEEYEQALSAYEAALERAR